MARPARVRIRVRKPCTRARRRLFGWYVRLPFATVDLLHLTVRRCLFGTSNTSSRTLTPRQRHSVLKHTVQDSGIGSGTQDVKRLSQITSQRAGKTNQHAAARWSIYTGQQAHGRVRTERRGGCPRNHKAVIKVPRNPCVNRNLGQYWEFSTAKSGQRQKTASV